MQKNINILKIENGNRALVHFHGFTSCKEENKILMDICKKNNISYYGIDFPGQGNSWIDDRDKPTMEYISRIACNFIKSLNKKDIIISGHSMGGAIAINVSSMLDPSIIKKIVLENPVNQSLLDEEKNRINLLNILKSKEDCLICEDDNLVSISFDEKKRKWYKDLGEDLASESFLNNLNKIMKVTKCQFDIIYGVEDKLIPYKESLNSFKSLPTSSKINIYEIENARHVPHNENQDKYVEVMQKILGE